MLSAFIESYLFEPANYFAGDTNLHPTPSANLYLIDGYPSSLHPYNHGFDQKDPCISTAKVDCCVGLCWCVCVGNKEHLFMASEDIVVCNGCMNVVCLICAFKIEIEHNNNNKVSYCMEWYGETKLVPKNLLLTEHVSRADMMAALSTSREPVTSTNDVNDTKDLYKAMITNKQAT
jgi:hypothetical protein